MDCWQHEIDKATSEEDVVKSASDYLVLWAPREIPPWRLGLAEMRIADGGDIERVNFHLATRSPNTALAPVREAHLRELASYFNRASQRIVELRG